MEFSMKILSDVIADFAKHYPSMTLEQLNKLLKEQGGK